MSESTSFVKRSIKNKFARKRKQSTSSDGSDSEKDSAELKDSAPIVKKKFNPNKQSTTVQKRSRKQENDSDSDNVHSSDEEITVKYKSKRTVMPEGPRDQGATAELEIETEKDRDAHALFLKSQEINKELEGKADDKVTFTN